MDQRSNHQGFNHEIMPSHTLISDTDIIENVYIEMPSLIKFQYDIKDEFKDEYQFNWDNFQKEKCFKKGKVPTDAPPRQL